MKLILKYTSAIIAVVLSTMLIINTVTVHAAVPGTNIIVNYDATGTGVASGGNQTARISEDGNIVVWTSSSRSVIPGDTQTGSGEALYKRNIKTGEVFYTTFDLNGNLAGSDSYFKISRTGRYVAFTSTSKTLVSSPIIPSTTFYKHLYITDTQTGTTQLVDKDASGALSNGTEISPDSINVSDDGRFVTFRTNATNLLESNNSPSTTWDPYLKDLHTGKVVSLAMSNSGIRANSAVLTLFSSCDGSYAVFRSNSTNLTPQDDGKTNTYLVDLRGGYKITNLTSTANNSVVPVSISCNGRYIIMSSVATNITSDSVSGAKNHYFRYDRLTGAYDLVDKSTSGYISNTNSPYSTVSSNGDIVSDDGKVVFISHDPNMVSPSTTKLGNVYIRNVDQGTTELVTRNAAGAEQDSNGGNMQVLSINARGTVVIYNNLSTNLIPGFTTGQNKLVLSKLE